MPKFQALPLSKKDAPKDAAAAAALTQSVKAIANQYLAMKTKTACVEFFESLNAYAVRNVAELKGTPARPSAKKPAAKSAEKAMAATA